MYCEILWIFVISLWPVSSRTAIKLRQGTLIGSDQATVFGGRRYYAFYGVPYAAPPVGRLRFRDPRPPKTWDEPLDASVEFHGSCAQAHVVHKHALYGVEDCLYLNVFTPHIPSDRNETMRPVLVWIHGYAFSTSFSHIYGSDFLIDNDVLLVTLSHRIGVFGFLKMNKTDSNVNMGLKDIVMALKWIKKNILYFGGDKKKVTLMGSSSAATFISLLLTTKHRKLFSKIILHSGALFSPSIFQGDPDLELSRLKKNLREITNKDITKAAARDIIQASLKIYSNRDIMNFQRSVVPFSPIVEEQLNTSLITKHPDDFFKSNRKVFNIPILTGFNSQESIAEVIPFLHNPRFLKSLSTFFKYMVPFSNKCAYNYTTEQFKTISRLVKDHYFVKGISETSIDDFMRYVSDLYKFPILKMVDVYLKKKKEVYMYKFNYVGTLNAVKSTATAALTVKVKGAAGGDETCYIFRCEPLWEQYKALMGNVSNKDRILIKVLSELWANFAKTGRPTAPTSAANVTWLPMTAKHDYVLSIGSELKIIASKSEKPMYNFWQGLFNTYYSDDVCNNLINKHDEL